jgi:hypothetical protein
VTTSQCAAIKEQRDRDVIRDAFKDADRIEGDMGATTGSSWKTPPALSHGGPIRHAAALERRDPWSKKHPDGGSATAQRTDSVTCNAIPSAQVVHSTPTKRPELTTHPRSRDG